jgi:hypothetical protein
MRMSDSLTSSDLVLGDHMAVLSLMFTEQELAPIRSGISTYIRLLGMFYSPDPLQLRWITDEGDLKAALRSVADAFKSTSEMVGKQKYQDTPYNAPKEVLKLMATYLLSGLDDRDQALQRRRNLPMYHLVIEPVTQLFYKFDHRMMIDIADAMVTELCEMVDQCTDYGTLEQALEAHQRVRGLIAAKDQAILNERSSKRKRRKPHELLLAILAEEPIDENEYT